MTNEELIAFRVRRHGIEELLFSMSDSGDICIKDALSGQQTPCEKGADCYDCIDKFLKSEVETV